VHRSDGTHTHRCAHCHQPFDCDGEWVAGEDEDGRTIARCTRFHLQQEDLCDTCRQEAEREV
jgi:hypothetical protein